MNKADTSDSNDLSIVPPAVLSDPGPAYADNARNWQGIPGIERAANGRLWALWYSGGSGEGPDNFVVAATSGDDGRTWSGPRLAIDPPGRVRAYDPCLWHDPLGRLWLFWAQSHEWFDGRCGVWAIVTCNPGDERPAWSEPRRLCHGIMMNKPTVLGAGAWLMPAAVWDMDPKRPELDEYRCSNVMASIDHGKTWTRRGGADVPGRGFDEHMLVERRDGSLWMLIRGRSGILQSSSRDGGATWGAGGPSGIAGPSTRFHVRRLRSGNLLLVYHKGTDSRNNLAAFLSADDGATWSGGLLLDERDAVSYPDAVESPAGDIYVIYDRGRTSAKEILMAVVKEEDIIVGRCSTPGARLKVLVSRATGGG